MNEKDKCWYANETIKQIDEVLKSDIDNTTVVLLISQKIMSYKKVIGE